MTSSSEKLLFIAASAFASASDRRAFLELACQDAAVRDLIEELVELDRDSEEFFEFPTLSDTTAPGTVAGDPGDSVEADAESGIGARIGPYRLIDRLGSGGCGVVYLAEQQTPVKRRVALKIIRLGMDTESVITRFNLEREALALMDHPNIARVLDAGVTASGRPYFVMELVDGERITGYCDRLRLGLRARLELFIQVCDAIQHAHQKGVIHRDIKPSNVLVSDQGGRPVPKVIDFGIAKATAGALVGEGTVTKSGQLLGTPAYMSPEQAAGGLDVDTRSDIYSLGALLCELLTGSPPLRIAPDSPQGLDEIRHLVREGETGVPSARLRDMPAEEIREIARCRGVEPQRLPSLVSGDLDWIVMKAIEKERPRRYGTANGLAMDVQRYLREEPVLARPPSRRYLLTKMVRRHRVTFAAGGVALFGLLGGLGLATWLFLRERDAREEQARLRVVAEQAMANEVRLRENATAVDRIARAAVLLRYQEFEQADQLLEGLTVGLVPRSLEAQTVFTKVSEWNLAQGRHQTAAERFHILGHVLTSVDEADWEGISFGLLSIATATCLWAPPEQYETLRTLMIDRFARSANPIVAEHIVKASLLRPADAATIRRLRPLEGVLKESLTGDGKATPHMLAWRQFSLALIAYREGNYKVAANWAQHSLAMAKNSQPRRVSNELLYIMATLRQGDDPQARNRLADLRTEIDRWLNAPFQLLNSDGTLWYNQWMTGILLQEAGALLPPPEK